MSDALTVVKIKRAIEILDRAPGPDIPGYLPLWDPEWRKQDIARWNQFMRETHQARELGKKLAAGEIGFYSGFKFVGNHAPFDHAAAIAAAYVNGTAILVTATTAGIDIREINIFGGRS